MKRVLSLLAAGWLSCLFVQATTVQRLTLDQLTERAESIVHGRVVGARTYWSANGKTILTTYTLTVTETVKGTARNSIEVTTLGGSVGDLTMYVSGMPAFETGEDAVVFVERSAGFWTVLGWAQGKFSVRQGEVSNSVSDLSFPDGRAGTTVRMGLQEFLSQVRRRIPQVRR